MKTIKKGVKRLSLEWIHRHSRLAIGVVLIAVVGMALFPKIKQALIQSPMYDGHLQSADYWGAKPQIHSAGMGFNNIIGLPALDEQTVQAALGPRTCNARMVERPRQGNTPAQR
jgi:hypothetical protein